MSHFARSGILYITLLSMALALLPLNCIPSCMRSAFSDPVHRLENYDFDPSRPLESRIGQMPDFVLDHVRKMDNRTDYTPYLPAPGELAVIKKYISLLPMKTLRVLKERLIGIYFVNNLIGSGFTEWVKKGNDFYSFMVFNPGTLRENMSDWITGKENSCFRPDETYTISVDCGREYSGFMYILVHESTHAVDYAEHITPFVETALRDQSPHTGGITPFTRRVWTGIDVPEAGFDFPRRKDITFYGFRRGPLLPASAAPEMYGSLVKTPFVSLYGSMSWAEDLAEFIAFYHITTVLNQPYRITVQRSGRPVLSVEPMKSPLVAARIVHTRMFY